MNNCNCGKVSVPAAQVVPVNCEFVIPASYPYVRPVTDSYTCSCCGSTNPAMKDYPASGPYKGNAFALDNAYPYLIDTTSQKTSTHKSQREMTLLVSISLQDSTSQILLSQTPFASTS